MLPTQIRQQCPRCKGTGINDKKPLMVKGSDDQLMLAPPYHDKNDVNRPQYENCKECKGSGLTMQTPPTTIFKEGEKITITPEEARQRYEVAG
jgi:DnaJ-class molecular chaperone